MAATLGAGVQDGDLFKAMADHNAIAVCGTNMDVGVVGWATGGGQGLMTDAYGIGADNIMEEEIVTPTGDILTASACQNEDIFWAIRGGGGGTFGEILGVTVKAYLILSMELPGFNIAPKNDTSKLISPLREMLDNENATASAKFTNTWVPSWWHLVQNMPANENIGTERSSRSSRFIPRRAVEKDLDLLAQTFERIGPKANEPTNGVSNPSISGQSWNDSLPEQTADETIREIANGKGYALRQLAPDTGAYYNEAEPYEPDWKLSFWGPHYARLHAIKQKYDPKGLLWCRHCVGSEP